MYSNSNERFIPISKKYSKKWRGEKQSPEELASVDVINLVRCILIIIKDLYIYGDLKKNSGEK